MDADFIYEILLVPKRTERSHKPAVAIIPLTHITGGGAFLIKDWILEYVLELTSRSAIEVGGLDRGG